MYNINQEQVPFETDECLTKGICSVNPILTSIQEIILLHIKQLSFYLLKLRDFGVTNNSIRDLIIYSLFNIVSNAEYNQEEFHDLISKMDQSIGQSKALYENLCQEKNINAETIKTYFKHNKKFDLTDAIKKGEKYFLKKISSFTQLQKNLFDIMLFLVKSVSIKIVEAQRLEIDYDEAFFSVLTVLNAMNFSDFYEKEVKNEISKFINAYYELNKKIFYAQIEKYGMPGITDVSFSTTEGRAILVSGSDYKKLENVLRAVEKTDISVYTHGIEMLMTHAFPKLREFKNFKGHFGSGIDSAIIDFSTFPGPILMTKGTLQRVEYLYRGRLFTLDPIAPMGVVKIKDNNFEPLIKAAYDSKGFAKAQKKPSAKVGYNIEEIKKQINDILDKYLTGEIKHLYIIGLLNSQNANKQYFEKLLELLPKDCFAISLGHESKKENVIHFKSLYDYSLIYLIFKMIKNKIPFNKLNINVFLTMCDKHTIAHLLYLKEVGVKNVYMCKCPQSLINPSLVETLKESFGIKEMDNPQKDLEDTLKN